MRIAFLWLGVEEHYGKRFTDGLWLALKHLEQRHTIGYFEPLDRKSIDEFKPDVLLYWAALCENTKPMVASYPYPKAICFAGGPIEQSNVDGFDLYFTESTLNEEEFAKFGKPFKRAFGINEEIFVPMDVPKYWDASIWASFALWKRHDLFARSVSKGIAIGQHQAHEPQCYEVCKSHGVEVLEEMDKTKMVPLLNASKVALNTASFWGGGQRMTLEAMAMNLPVIVMSDSPKNREYVEESGFGMVVTPDPIAIRNAMFQLRGVKCNSRDYVLSKYSSKHYADSLEEGLLSVCNQKSQ